jgi:hypothetical protein
LEGGCGIGVELLRGNLRAASRLENLGCGCGVEGVMERCAEEERGREVELC